MRPVPMAAAAMVALLLARAWRRVAPTARALVVAAVVVLAAYGLGTFALPDVEATLLDLGATLGPWTYVLVAGLAFAETGLLLGLLTPGETALVMGGIVAGQGEVDVAVMVALVAVACVAGDALGFLLGHRFGRPALLRHGPRVRLTEERLRRVEALMHRHGGWVVLVGRFVGFVRPLAPFVAGAAHMPYRRFLPYDAVGCVLWTAAYVLLGHALWQEVERATQLAGVAVAVAAVLAALAALALWLRGRRHAGAR